MLYELLYITVGVLFYAFLISIGFKRDPILFAGCVIVWPGWALCSLFVEIFNYIDSPDCEYDNNGDDNAIELKYFHFMLDDENN